MTERLQEAAVIVPHRTRLGAPGDVIRKGLLAEACRLFGGYTELTGTGGWINPQGYAIREPISYVIVAAPADTGDVLVQAWAARVAHDLDQDEVFIRYGDGSVEILKRIDWTPLYHATFGGSIISGKVTTSAAIGL
jgi:hypothetical protein